MVYIALGTNGCHFSPCSKSITMHTYRFIRYYKMAASLYSPLYGVGAALVLELWCLTTATETVSAEHHDVSENWPLTFVDMLPSSFYPTRRVWWPLTFGQPSLTVSSFILSERFCWQCFIMCRLSGYSNTPAESSVIICCCWCCSLSYLYTANVEVLKASTAWARVQKPLEAPPPNFWCWSEGSWARLFCRPEAVVFPVPAWVRGWLWTTSGPDSEDKMAPVSLL